MWPFLKSSTWWNSYHSWHLNTNWYLTKTVVNLIFFSLSLSFSIFYFVSHRTPVTEEELVSCDAKCVATKRRPTEEIFIGHQELDRFYVCVSTGTNCHYAPPRSLRHRKHLLVDLRGVIFSPLALPTNCQSSFQCRTKRSSFCTSLKMGR